MDLSMPTSVLDVVESRPALHPAFAAVLPTLTTQLRHADDLSNLTVLLTDTEDAAPGSAASLSSHLGYVLNQLDVDGLRRWILTGFRLYPHHVDKLLAYFRLDDPAAADVMVRESQGTAFEQYRNSLQFYVAGFGLADLTLNSRRARALNAPQLRSIVSDSGLILPDHYLAWDGAINGDIYRAATAHALAHLRFSPRHQKAGTKKPLLIAVLSLIEDARVERLASQSFPGLWSLWNRFHTASGREGELTFVSLASRLARALHDPKYEDQNHWVNKGRELFEGVALHGLDDPAPFIEIGNILGNDLGQMRVRFVAETYAVQPGYRDDNSFLWEYDLDAPPDTPPEEMLSQNSVQLEMTDEGADSAVRISPVEINANITFEYPEWDHRENRLRERWATVLERAEVGFSAMKSGEHERHLIRGISLDTRSRTLDRSVKLRRQEEGEALDLNAAIDSRICLRAGVAPDSRIFQRPGKRRRHTSILLLMDLSESTNDRLQGFTSILDVEKKSAELLTKSVDRQYDRLAIDGFRSDGRSKVYYVRIKDFEEPFGAAQQQKLSKQQGELSTRMGAGLRHAGARLLAENNEKKILLFVTDGEPSDIDVIDREYLIEDARVAINALYMKGITVFCLTLDKAADSYVKTIFGPRNYMIVDNAMSLPTQLTRALNHMAAS